MYCPKCGQIAVHLNGKDVCTKCGIVFSDAPPREQVLNQIKSKMAKTQANFSQKEDYVSPVALAEDRSNKPKVLPRETVITAPETDTLTETKTLEDIQKEIRAGQRVLEDSMVQSQNTLDQQEPTPKEDSLSAREKAVSPPEAPIIHEFNEPLEKQSALSPQNVSNESIASNAQTTGITPEKTLENRTSSFEDINTYKKNQTIYPSHQVNPILIKMFITVFSVLVFFVIVYILYANIGLVKEWIDNITKLLGERVFA